MKRRVDPGATMSDEKSCIKNMLRQYHRFSSVFVFMAISVLTGCVCVGPDYIEPQIHLPDQWHTVSGGVRKLDGDTLANWWRVIDDALLNRLVAQAAANNLDHQEALSRVRQARFERMNTRSSLFPMLDATGAAAKYGHADSGDTTATLESDLYSAGFDAGWELDFFGGTRRAVEAAQADLAAEIESLNDVRVTLLAEVVLNYAELRTYQARLAVAKKNVQAQKETWQLLNALSQAGRGDELALAQARYNLESTRAGIPALEVGIAAAMNRLAVLTAQPIGVLSTDLAVVGPIPQVTMELVVGVPADVVRQRPDIRQAERELASQTARIGAAEAERYPKFSLTGSIGWEAVSAGNLFSTNSRSWSWGPSFSWSVFNAGAVETNIQVQTELQKQTMIHYRAVVFNAMEEVENALMAYAKELEKLNMLQSAVEAARLATELAEQQYTTGMTGFSDVLDAQRSLLSFEDQLAESQGTVLYEWVQLYKALGGGWQSFDQMIEPVKKG